MICFDAVGTLIYPFPNVATAYHDVSHKHGCSLGLNEIDVRFKRAFRANFVDQGNVYECRSSEVIEREKWLRVVQQVFEAEFSESLFEDVWNYFSLPENWKVIPETAKILSEWVQQGIDVGIASNFDRRIIPLINFYFPRVKNDRIFYSTDLGFAKPDVRFYKEIENRIGRLAMVDSKRQFTMIGDTFSNDYEAARRAGWDSFFLKVNDSPRTLDALLALGSK